MSDKLKTIPDIIANKRRIAKDIRDHASNGDYWDKQKANEEAEEYEWDADDIEAAYKRERATTENSSAVGNTAKLREVVELLARVILPPQEEYPAEYGGGKVPDEDGWLAWIRQMQVRACDALAAPARNCDIMSLETARKVWFAKEIVPRLNGDLPLGKEVPFEDWFVSQHEQGESNEQK